MKQSIASGIAAFAAVSMSAGIFADDRTIPVAGGDAPCDSLPYFERVAEVSEAALERLSAKFDARIASIRRAVRRADRINH